MRADREGNKRTRAGQSPPLTARNGPGRNTTGRLPAPPRTEPSPLPIGRLPAPSRPRAPTRFAGTPHRASPESGPAPPGPAAQLDPAPLTAPLRRGLPRRGRGRSAPRPGALRRPAGPARGRSGGAAPAEERRGERGGGGAHTAAAPPSPAQVRRAQPRRRPPRPSHGSAALRPVATGGGSPTSFFFLSFFLL